MIEKLNEELISLIEEKDILLWSTMRTNSKLKRVPHTHHCTVVSIVTDKINGEMYSIGIVVKFLPYETKEYIYELFDFGDIEYKFGHEDNVQLLTKRLNK